MKQLVSQIDFKKISNKVFIDGVYIATNNPNVISAVNPANGDVLCELAHAQEEEVAAAIKTAKAAFNQGVWCDYPPAKRKKILIRFSQLLSEHKQELAMLECLDVGKPLRECLSLDLPLSINSVLWHAEAIDKIYDEIAPTENNRLGMIVNEPLGVIVAITAWNFPLMLAMRKVAPALAMGNSVILKPSERASLSCLWIAELALKSGIPPGVFNVLSGFGMTTGKLLACHKDVNCVTFTGSTETAKKIVQYSGQSNLKRTFLECGGKSANIIFNDCYDISHVAQQTAHAIFYNQGEVCSAASRLIVESSIKQKVLSNILQCTDSMQPGDPLANNSYMGPLIDKAHFQQVLSSINMAKQEGAKLVIGGEQVLKDSGGYYITPTIFDEVTPDMKIFQEEIFGPVLVISTFETESQAIELANATQYGLAGAVWSSDIARCHRIARKVSAGTVSINCWLGGDMTVPFGGMKQSGNGRDKSLHAMKKYVETKTIWVNLADKQIQ